MKPKLFTEPNNKMSLNDLFEDKRYWVWFEKEFPELANSARRNIASIDKEITRRGAFT